MSSKARIAGHAAHPMVAVIPIALFTITVAVLLAYVGTRDASYYRAALVANVAGVVAALPALPAPPSPSPSRSREIVDRHALGPLLVTAVFTGSGALLYRGWTGRAMVDGRWELDAAIPLAIGVLGLVLLVSVAMLESSPTTA
jgi:uncharacterized membrane protein